MFSGKFPKYAEFRLLAILGSIALSIYLLGILSSFLSMFTDIFLILILSWLLAFILDPLVNYFVKKGQTRLASCTFVYALLALGLLLFFAFVIPATINQLSALVTYLPNLFANAPVWAARLEDVLTSALSNSLAYAQALASLLAGGLLIAVISFYLLLSKKEIENTLSNLIPDNFREDYLFLQKTLNTTFASFLRVQVLIGVIVAMITIVVLEALKIQFALSSGLLAGVLAMIPVVGPIISIVPPLLAGATVSADKGIVAGLALFLIYQLIYNIVAPRLVGSALKIHPVFVLLSFVIGFKLAGAWGAIFAVPVAVSVAIILKELIKHWRQEADQITS